MQQVTLQIDPAAADIERDEGNNELQGWVLVATWELWLPIAFKNAGG